MNLKNIVCAAVITGLSLVSALEASAQVDIRIGPRHRHHYYHRRPVVRERVVVRERPVVHERVIVRGRPVHRRYHRRHYR